MSVDGYQTQDVAYCAALCYTYGIEALTKVEIDGHLKIFHLDIASNDGEEYLKDWNSGQFNVTDLKTFMKMYSNITQILRDLTRTGESEWTPRWQIVPTRR